MFLAAKGTPFRWHTAVQDEHVTALVRMFAAQPTAWRSERWRTLGLNRTDPPPVVVSMTLGGEAG